jgi:two-component system sensor histidine kinase DcuS
MRKKSSPMKLSSTITLMSAMLIISVLFVVCALFFVEMGNRAQDDLKQRISAIANTLSDSPIIINGLQHPQQQADVQVLAEKVRQKNNLMFVVVMDMNAIRFSHPNDSMIGKHFIGDDVQPALHGKSSISQDTGSLGPSLRIFSPVFDATGQQIGVIAVGISISEVEQIISQSRWIIDWAVVFGVLIGALGSFWLNRKIKQWLLGLEPYQIANLFEQRNAMLQSIREGVVAVDAQSQITLINDEAKRLFAIGQQTQQGKEVLPAPILQLLAEGLEQGNARYDEQVQINDNILLANMVPLHVKGQRIGAMATLRDKTEVTGLIQRLNGISDYAQALRMQSHEFMNKLHVILGLLHMKNYSRLESFILKTADNYHLAVGSLLSKIKSPVIAGFLIAKINEAKALNVSLVITDDSYLPDMDDADFSNTLITLLGNIIDNAFDAVSKQDEKRVVVAINIEDDFLYCTIGDNGCGISADDSQHIFQCGFSTKGVQRGLGLFLVKESVERMGGSIEFVSEPHVLTQFILTIPCPAKGVAK